MMEDTSNVKENLEQILHDEIQRNNLNISIIEPLLNENIQMQILTTNIQEIVILTDKSNVSIKPHNIIINLRKSIDSLMDLILSFTLPDCLFNVILCLLNFIYRVVKLATIKIESSHAKVIKFLYQNNAFNSPVEEKVVNEFISSITDIAPSVIIHDLFRLFVIDIRNGEISLKEKVVIKRG